MSPTLLEQMAAGEAPPVMSLTVEQYHRMIRMGILRDGAPVELIDGLLVWKDRSAQGADPMSHDPRHASTITRLQRLERRLEPFQCHPRIQLPVTLSETDEPESDVAVVKGTPGAFSERHPGPADVIAAIEVADSSLRYDRTTKKRKYALAGINQYWIVNLPENQIEVYTSPVTAEGRYADHVDYRVGESVRLAVDATNALEILVADVLPQ